MKNIQNHAPGLVIVPKIRTKDGSDTQKVENRRLERSLWRRFLAPAFPKVFIMKSLSYPSLQRVRRRTLCHDGHHFPPLAAFTIASAAALTSSIVVPLPVLNLQALDARLTTSDSSRCPVIALSTCLVPTCTESESVWRVSRLVASRAFLVACACRKRGRGKERRE